MACLLDAVKCLGARKLKNENASVERKQHPALFDLHLHEALTVARPIAHDRERALQQYFACREGLLYDELKPLPDGSVLGLGGINGERGSGDHFFFLLR